MNELNGLIDNNSSLKLFLELGLQLSGVFAGAFLAFISGYYLSKHSIKNSESARKKLIINNIISELNFNINLLEKYINEFKTRIEEIKKDQNDRHLEIFEPKHSQIRHYHLEKGYRSGYLLNYLNMQYIQSLFESLGKYSQNSDLIWLNIASKRGNYEDYENDWIIELLQSEIKKMSKDKKLFSKVFELLKKTI